MKIIIEIPNEEVEAVIGSYLDNKFKELKILLQKQEIQVLTRTQAAKFLNITPPTLDKYTKNGSVKGYKLDGRPAYNISDLLDSLEEIKEIKYQREIK